jgi:hypothetical protein
VSHARFDFAFPVRVLNPAGHGDCAVVGQHIAIERVDAGIVDIRLKHTLFEVVEHHDSGLCEGPDYAQENTRRPYEQFCGPQNLLIIRA